MTRNITTQDSNVSSITEDHQKRDKDLENLFEAEVEYVFDELQKKALEIFGSETVSVPDCAAEIGHRLAGITPCSCGRRYWLRDMGIIVLQIMTMMESHGYKVSEEILEILAQAKEDYRAAEGFANERRRLAS